MLSFGSVEFVSHMVYYVALAVGRSCRSRLDHSNLLCFACFATSLWVEVVQDVSMDESGRGSACGSDARRAKDLSVPPGDSSSVAPKDLQGLAWATLRQVQRLSWLARKLQACSAAALRNLGVAAGLALREGGRVCNKDRWKCAFGEVVIGGIRRERGADIDVVLQRLRLESSVGFAACRFSRSFRFGLWSARDLACLGEDRTVVV